MNDPELEALVDDVDALQACLVFDPARGQLHREYRRETGSMDSAAAARAVANLARAQAALVDPAGAPAMSTLEWPGTLLLVRSVSKWALVSFFFSSQLQLGLARMHVERLLAAMEPLLPAPGPAPSSERPQPVAPSVAISARPAPRRAARAPRAAEGGSAPEPERPGSLGSVEPRDVLEYLEAHAPDSHAALVRVSLQTGLPLKALQAPGELSAEDYDHVMQAVHRVLGAS